MAYKSILTIVNNALDELLQSRATAFYGEAGSNQRFLLQLFNRHGRDVRDSNESGWNIMQRLHTFNTVASTAEYALPSDFDHLLADTVWDRTRVVPGVGSLSAVQWQTIKSGLIGTGAIYPRYRIVRSQVSGVDRKFIIDPTPTAVEAMAFEYVSTDWLCNSIQTLTYEEVAADTNLCLLDSDLMVLGLKWRWRKEKGFEFTTGLAEYNEKLDYKISTDTPLPALSLSGPMRTTALIGYANIPESGFG